MKTVRCIPIILVAMIFFTGAGISGTHAQGVTGESYVANQLIVQYSADSSPDRLLAEITKRREESKATFAGGVKLLLSDIKAKVQGEETPEEKLSNLRLADTQIGVVAKRQLFLDDRGTDDIYLLRLNGTLTVPQAVTLYRQIPDIVFVEPNYVYGGMGI